MEKEIILENLDESIVNEATFYSQQNIPSQISQALYLYGSTTDYQVLGFIDASGDGSKGMIFTDQGIYFCFKEPHFFLYEDIEELVLVKKEEGHDPASVVYEAIRRTKETSADVLIVDTAGRLHNKKYLMDELHKIKKVINKEMGDLSQEVLLVLDATTGQNAINQVKAFKQETDVTGLVLTKLDGSSKGGVVVGIVEENKIPVKFIGVGEQIDDMEIFNSEDFAKAII